MADFLEDLAARRRFGMRPGLDAIRALLAEFGNPHTAVPAVHIAGTNGKGAVAAILDSCLRAAGQRVGRYTSPHLVRLNERFFLDGAAVSDDILDGFSSQVARLVSAAPAESPYAELTFFEALTAVAFLLYAHADVDFAVLETGLGGRLDATNVCCPSLCVITKIGLDHCDWLGDCVEKIAREKSGIIKPGVPVVLGRNEPSVRAVIRQIAETIGAPFYYAPDWADVSEVPSEFTLSGAFNRENAVTALAALKVLGLWNESAQKGFAQVAWPGRFQLVGDVLIDGAHNPPAAEALVEAMGETRRNLIFGACGDKDVDRVLSILAPHVVRGFAVRTNNPRSLPAAETAARMRAAGIPSTPCTSLAEALAQARQTSADTAGVLVCGSLFLAGEALVALGATPGNYANRIDPSEILKNAQG